MKPWIFLLATAAVGLAQDNVSATGTACEAHGDHWHCPSGVPEPTTPPASGSATTAIASSTTGQTEATACEPHGDHWHCPSGIAEPTTPPPAASTGEDHDHEDEHDHEATAATCEPHNDHWHCPSGVAEPTTPPAMTITTSTSATATAAESAAVTSSEFDGAAVVAGPMGSIQMAAAGMFGLLFL